MTIFTKTANDVFAGYDSAGNARSIIPHDGQVWGTEVERTLQGVTAGATIYDSKADMDADTSQAANAMAWVLGDDTAANNGIYQFDGTATWTRLGDLPYSYIKATNAGAGTANAIQATTSTPIPAADGGALIALPIVADNTANPVTVSFNGVTYTIKTNSGNDPVVGGLTAGMIAAGYVSGSTFRLLSDQASAAVMAAAEADANRAEAAASGIEGSPVYDTKALAEAITPASAPAFIDIAGRDYAGDGRGGRFVYHGTSAPSHIRWLKITLSGGTDAYYVSTRPVHVIASSGQSNMDRGGAVAGYSKPNNIYKWNLNLADTSSLGDGWVDGGGAYAEVGLSYGGWHAADHPEADVYVINVAHYSYQIMQWLPDPTTGIDMYAVIQNNVTAALAQIGVSKIDELLWWQGEGDYNSSTYVTDWQTLYARLLNESWFGWDVPVKLFGISTFGTPSLGNIFNKNLIRIAALYPNAITYYHTSVGFAGYWDAADDYIHLLVSSIPEKTAGAYRAGRYSTLWSDPYYNLVGASSLLAGRFSPVSTDVGAGVIASGAGVVSTFAAGTGTNFHLAFYNDAANTPALVGQLYSNGTKLAFSVTGTFAIEAGVCELPTVTKIGSSGLPGAADDTAAAAAGVPLYGLYRNGNAVQIRMT